MLNLKLLTRAKGTLLCNGKTGESTRWISVRSVY